MSRLWTTCLLLVLLIGTVGCDQATKHWARATLAERTARNYLGDVVTLEYAENAGAFLSLGAEWPPRVRFALFTVGAPLLLAGAILALARHAASTSAIAGLVLFLGGGASNFVDRLTRGSVIDFLNVGIGPVRTGVFNVADLAIVAGVALAAFSWTRRAQ